MHHRGTVAQAIRVICSCVVAAGVVAGCGGSISQKSLNPPSVPTSPSISPGVVPSAIASPPPAVTPQPTAPAAGQPWGGLVWSGPIKLDLPWGHYPEEILTWQGRQLGIGRTGPLDKPGEVLIASSTDLVHWTTLTRGSSAPTAGMDGRWIVAGSSRLVAFGLAGDPCETPYPPAEAVSSCPIAGIWTSPDAITWTRVDSPAILGARVFSVSGGPAGIVAVGSAGWNQPVIWFSPTGTTWHQVTLSSSTFSDANLSAVSAVANGFVALGTVGEPVNPEMHDPNGPAGAWWSPDGLNWTLAQVNGTEGEPRAVHGAGQGLVASGSYGPWDAPWGAVWSSSDGRSWRRLECAIGDDGSLVPGTVCFTWLEQIAADGTRAIALTWGEQAGIEAWQTFDGSQWAQLRVFGDFSLSSVSGLWITKGMIVTPQGILVYGYGENFEPILVSAAAVP